MNSSTPNTQAIPSTHHHRGLLGLLPVVEVPWVVTVAVVSDAAFVSGVVARSVAVVASLDVAVATESLSLAVVFTEGSIVVARSEVGVGSLGPDGVIGLL